MSTSMQGTFWIVMQHEEIWARPKRDALHPKNQVPFRKWWCTFVIFCIIVTITYTNLCVCSKAPLLHCRVVGIVRSMICESWHISPLHINWADAEGLYSSGSPWDMYSFNVAWQGAAGWWCHVKVGVTYGYICQALKVWELGIWPLRPRLSESVYRHSKSSTYVSHTNLIESRTPGWSYAPHLPLLRNVE